MDVGIFASKSFGGRLNVSNSPKPESKDASSAADQSTDAAPVPLPPAKAFSTDPLVTELSDRLAANQTLPGGSVQILSKSETSIGVRRVFDRPVAVGFRGLLLAVDLETNLIVGISVDSSQNPDSRVSGEMIHDSARLVFRPTSRSLRRRQLRPLSTELGRAHGAPLIPLIYSI
jgi:hypothetical protein